MPSIKDAFNYFAEPEKYKNLSTPRKIAVGVLSGLCLISIVGTIFSPLVWKGTTNLLTKKVAPIQAPKIHVVASKIIPPKGGALDPSSSSSKPKTKNDKFVEGTPPPSSSKMPEIKNDKKDKSPSSDSDSDYDGGDKSSTSSSSSSNEDSDTDGTYSGDGSTFDPLVFTIDTKEESAEEQIEQLKLAPSMDEKFKILEKSGVAIYEADEEFDPEDLNTGDFALKKTEEGVNIHWRRENDDSLRLVSCDYKWDKKEDIVKPLTLHKLWPIPAGKKMYKKAKKEQQPMLEADKEIDHEKMQQIAALEAKNLIYPKGAKLRETLGKGKHALIRTENKDEFVVVFKSTKGIYYKTRIMASSHLQTDISRFIIQCSKNAVPESSSKDTLKKAPSEKRSEEKKGETSHKEELAKGKLEDLPSHHSERTPGGKFVILSEYETLFDLEPGEARLIRTGNPKIVQLAYRTKEGKLSLNQVFALSLDIEKEVEAYIASLEGAVNMRQPEDSREFKNKNDEISELKKDIFEQEIEDLKKPAQDIASLEGTVNEQQPEYSSELENNIEEEIAGLQKDISDIEKEVADLQDAEFIRAIEIAVKDDSEFEQKIKERNPGFNKPKNAYLILMPHGVDLEKDNYSTLKGSKPDKVKVIYRNKDGIYLASREELEGAEIASFINSLRLPAILFKIRSEHKRYLNRLEK